MGALILGGIAGTIMWRVLDWPHPWVGGIAGAVLLMTLRMMT